MKYNDVGGQYANVHFDISENYDLSSNYTFSLKIYVPSSGITGSQPNQVSLKLQDGTLPQPWFTQCEIIKPIELDQWQIVTFDFLNDDYSNFDSNSLPPTQRTDFNRVLIQVNGENNYEHVVAYIDDFNYDGTLPADSDFDVLVWSDEFETDGAVDNNKWHHETKLPTAWGWHNGEIQHYTDRMDNSYISNGILHIVGKKETYTDQGLTKEYTSARLNSKFAFKYGKVEVRAKLPIGAGTWPAIWMLGKNVNIDYQWWDMQGYGTTPWPDCGEIDIMEHWGSNQNQVTSATHTPSSYGGTVNKGGQTVSTASTEFHTYTLKWYPDKLEFSVDGVTHYTYQPNELSSDKWPFDAEQFLLLNFAILPEIESGFTEDALEIDYVRIYQNQNSVIGDGSFPEELDQERVENKKNALNLHRKHKNSTPYDLDISVFSSEEYESRKPSGAMPFDCGYVDEQGRVFVSEPLTAEQTEVFSDIDQAAIYYMCHAFLQHYYQTTEMPIWFKTGFAAYESGMRMNDADIKTAYNNYNGTITSFDVLNNRTSFIDNNGLAVAYMFGEFMGVYTPWKYYLISGIDASSITTAPSWNNVESTDKLFEIWLRYFTVRILESDEQNRIKPGKETEHFKFYYREADVFWADASSIILEDALNEYIGLLDFEIYEKFSYITMPECDFALINGVDCINRYTGGTAWSSGLSSTSPNNGDDIDRFEHLIRHELAHLVQAHLPVGNMTAWLNEGFAEFLSRQPDTREDKVALKNQTQNALDNALNYFGHLPTFEDTKVYPGQSNFDYYLMGQIMHNFIYEKGGYSAIKDIMLNHETGITNLGYASPEVFMNAYYYYLNTEYLQKEEPDYFTSYESFISKLTSLTSSADNATELDAFWDDLLATGNFPFAIGSKVAFLYRGTANTISWAGDFNGWDMNADPGIRLGESNVWLLEKEFPSDARSSYKIVKNGSEWISDEHNPHPQIGDYNNSDLRMPDYKTPPETIKRPSIPTGMMSENIQKYSSNLNYNCQYTVYTPAGYSELSNLPVIYVTDGPAFSDESLGKMTIILDNLIYDGTLEPVIAVFLDPRDPDNLSHNRRSDEYRNNINFVKYVTEELVPDIDAAYKTNATPGARAIAGSSYGGYNAAYFCAMATEYIQNTAILSPIMHPNPPEEGYNIYDDMMAADLSNTKIYMSYGIFDSREINYFNQLKDIFEQKNKEFDFDVVSESHNFSNWSGVIGNALQYFFPGPSNYPPVVSDIPNQTIVNGNNFATIQLNNYITDEDNPDSEITWSFDGNLELGIIIDENSVASISMPQQDWTGSETITFTARDPFGNIGSDAVVFTSNESTAITDFNNELTFSIYPNPSSKHVYISVPGKTNLSIFTVSGLKVLEKKNFQSGFIDVTHFSKGVYFVSIMAGNRIITQKLVVE